jgi:c-di-GMP-binding flagellar brake protein YcgR
MQERRKYARLDIPLEITYSIQGKSGSKYKTIIKNISPGGVSFVLKEDLPKGAVLNISLKLPTRPEPIPIKAKLVWSRKGNDAKENSYNAGFEFIRIPEESKTEFFQYLCNLMYDQLRKLG